MLPCGLIVLNKPPGVTSRQALNHVVRLVKPSKAGHAGTLDPIADGVLVVCVGSATRLTRYVQQMEKRYRATFLLGRESPTDDIEVAATELIGAPRPTEAEIRKAMAEFVGLIDQRPPDFSAIKIDGRRAYDLARAGKSPELKTRKVRIDVFDLIEYEYPRLQLDVACGSGTYVRSLGRDLAKRLGTGAVMSALTRTAIGNFDLAASIAPQDLTPENLADRLLAPRWATVGLKPLAVDALQYQELLHGRPIRCDIDPTASEIAAVTANGDLIAILTPLGGDLWRPTCNFAQTLPSPTNHSE